MTKMIYAIAALLILGGLAYNYRALEIFNFLMPKDSGSKLIKADISFGADPRQKLDVYAPSEGTGPWPVIVFIHGGSWNSGNKNAYSFVGRALAAQGYLVALPNYRLTHQAPFPAFVEDSAMALDWATRHAAEYGGDEKNVFGMGHSAGAYNIALAVLDPSYLAKQKTDLTSLRGVITLSGPFDFLPLDSPITIKVFGHVADLPSTQPVTYARGDAPPFLILHGGDDKTVYPRNGQSLAARLKAAGADATLKIYPGISHVGMIINFALPLRRSAVWLDDIKAFITAKRK